MTSLQRPDILQTADKLSERALEYIVEILRRIEETFGVAVKDAVESYCIPNRPFNAMKRTEALGAYLGFMQENVDDWSFLNYAEVSVDFILAEHMHDINAERFVNILRAEVTSRRHPVARREALIRRFRPLFGYSIANTVHYLWVAKRRFDDDLGPLVDILTLKFGSLPNLSHYAARIGRN